MNPEIFRRRVAGFASAPRAEAPAVSLVEGVASLSLFDPIDSWGDSWGGSAKEVAKVVAQIPADATEIRLHINSPGGDVFDGIAVLNTLRSHGARFVAVVDGLAASAASFIAAGADELIMAPNSELMIHDAWGGAVGNAADMAAMAELLDHVSDNIASIYAAKAGGDVATWRAAMRAESWFTADEAVAAGLADSVAERTSGEAKNRFDLSIFQFAGRDSAPAPVLAESPGAVAPEVDEAPEPVPTGNTIAPVAVRRWTAARR